MYDITRPHVSTCREHTEPKYNNRVCIYYSVQSVTLHPPFSRGSVCLEDVWLSHAVLVLVATGLCAGTTLLSTVIGAIEDLSGLECR